MFPLYRNKNTSNHEQITVTTTDKVECSLAYLSVPRRIANSFPHRHGYNTFKKPSNIYHQFYR